MSVPEVAAPRSFTERLLAGVERVGNKVPNAVLMFLYLIVLIAVLSQVLDLLGVSVTETIAEPVPVPTQADYFEDTAGVILDTEAYPDEAEFEVHEVTIAVRGLLDVEGIRFVFTSFVSNFAGFGVIAVVFIAMMGAGAAEGAGLMDALIRKLVTAAPRRLITFLIVLVGALSSVATDAGYLILIPLAAVAFHKLGRHPLAGLAAGFAGVAATFVVNVIPTPVDAMITEIANEAIALTGLGPVTIVNNYFFSVVSMFVLVVAATVVTERMVEPRLGRWDPAEASADQQGADVQTVEEKAAEARGLRFATFGFLAVLVVVLLATGIIPAAIATLLAAMAMVLLRVVTVEQAHRSMSWTVLILIAAMIPLSAAITNSGTAEALANGLLGAIGGGGPLLIMTGLFLVTAVLGQLISNTATALVLIPIAVSVATEGGYSVMAVLMSLNVAAHAALLTPIATPANLMVMGPAGYRFDDYWKFGLPVMAVYYLVAVFLVPLFWPV